MTVATKQQQQSKIPAQTLRSALKALIADRDQVPVTFADFNKQLPPSRPFISRSEIDAAAKADGLEVEYSTRRPKGAASVTFSLKRAGVKSAPVMPAIAAPPLVASVDDDEDEDDETPAPRQRVAPAPQQDASAIAAEATRIRQQLAERGVRVSVGIAVGVAIARNGNTMPDEHTLTLLGHLELIERQRAGYSDGLPKCLASVRERFAQKQAR